MKKSLKRKEGWLTHHSREIRERNGSKPIEIDSYKLITFEKVFNWEVKVREESDLLV